MSNSSAQAVGYATKQLGFQTVYDESVEAEGTLAQALEEVRLWADKKRNIAELILDRQADLATEERANKAELSATAFEAHMKIAIRQDRNLKELRADLASAAIRHEEAEHKAREAELVIRTRTARMTELGGYFQYLAATALLQANNTQQENSS